MLLFFIVGISLSVETGVEDLDEGTEPDESTPKISRIASSFNCDFAFLYFLRDIFLLVEVVEVVFDCGGC